MMRKKITSLAIVLTLAFGVILASTAVSSVEPAIVVFAQKNQSKAVNVTTTSTGNA